MINLLVLFGLIIRYIIAPVLRIVASLYMAVSIYNTLKAENHKHKALWTVFAIVFPIIACISFAVYRKRRDTPKTEQSGKAKTLFIHAVVSFVGALIFAAGSFLLVAPGAFAGSYYYAPSSAVYDIKGNSYNSYEDIPLYDKDGNEYFRKTENGLRYCVDKYGNEYQAVWCYLDEDGFFYFDDMDDLQLSDEYSNMYTDGEKMYYSLDYIVYWDENGKMYSPCGVFRFELQYER